jgi:predicted HTH domain antitoxin
MSTTELKMDLPVNISEDEIKLLLAIKLYEVGKLSLGQAAQLARFSKRGFIDVLGQHHVPVLNYSPDDLSEEIGV